MTKILASFDFSALASPAFKEDAVREELITPILHELGYRPSGESTLIRSWALKHPFVHIGTKTNKINIIPDYTLSVDGQPKWILDAKSPGENITKGKNLEQAYSYAIHPEIRAEHYALCNGHDFHLFHISHVKAVLKFPVASLEEAWPHLLKLVSPVAYRHPYRLHMRPDFGVHMVKLGLAEEDVFNIFVAKEVKSIGKPKDGQYTIGAHIAMDADLFAVSFDFDQAKYEQLLTLLEPKQREATRNALSQQPYFIMFEDADQPIISITAHLGENVLQNENEDYIPFIVESFF